ncbi:MAG: ester cyclase [Gammaproteobacteria bacterium]|nr:ester cyclase [Gammaproteobacteria bacterium]
MKFLNLFNSIFFTLIMMGAIQIASATEMNKREWVKPKSITIDKSLNKSTAKQMLDTAQLYYTFWNSGNTKYLDAVLSPNFIDHTLPQGRPQGPEGLKLASKTFRQAVPNLSCSLDDLLIVGEMVTARLLFEGTFAGEFKGHPPTNKPVKFLAIDILHIKEGKIIEDWHLEDNLTLMQQLNAVKIQ